MPLNDPEFDRELAGPEDEDEFSRGVIIVSKKDDEYYVEYPDEGARLMPYDEFLEELEDKPPVIRVVEKGGWQNSFLLNEMGEYETYDFDPNDDYHLKHYPIAREMFKLLNATSTEPPF